MSLIDWNESFSVGVAEIDSQHKNLVGMINELHEAMLQRKTNDVLGNIIQRLSNYTVTHFSTEEKYFDKFGYPNAKPHKIQHQDFVKKVTDFQEKFNKNQVALGIEIMQFLKDWLIGHIKGSDKAYTEFFHSKGLK